MHFDDLWPHLERFSEAEVEAIHKAAHRDKIFRLEQAGLLLIYLVAIVGLSFGIPAFYRSFEPSLSVRIVLAVALSALIFFGVKGLIRLTPMLYDRAVVRQARLWGRGNGP